MLSHLPTVETHCLGRAGARGMKEKGFPPGVPGNFRSTLKKVRSAVKGKVGRMGKMRGNPAGKNGPLSSDPGGSATTCPGKEFAQGQVLPAEPRRRRPPGRVPGPQARCRIRHRTGVGVEMATGGLYD